MTAQSSVNDFRNGRITRKQMEQEIEKIGFCSCTVKCKCVKGLHKFKRGLSETVITTKTFAAYHDINEF